MLKIIMLFLGVLLMAPVAIVAFIFALPALPFALVAWVVWRMIRSRRSSARVLRASRLTDPRTDYRIDQSSAFAPMALTALALLTAAQIKIVGFSWQLEVGLGLAMMVVGGLWMAQRRLHMIRHSRGKRGGSIASHDLYQLFEIERATGPEERHVLIARELNRLTREALRPDPTLPNSWPSAADLMSLRDQVRLLRSSAHDTPVSIGPDINTSLHPSPLMLKSGIQILDDYVNLLLRVRLIGQGDLEQMRVLVRDQSRLRAMQDEFVGHLQETTPIQVAG